KRALTGVGYMDFYRATIASVRPSLSARGVHAPSVDAVLAQALAIRPEDRFAHAADFWRALVDAASAYADTQPSDRPQARFERSRRWLRALYVYSERDEPLVEPMKRRLRVGLGELIREWTPRKLANGPGATMPLPDPSG